MLHQTAATFLRSAFYDSDFGSITAGTFLIGGSSHTGNIFIANDGGTLSFGSALSVQNSSSGIITIGDYTSSNDALTLTSAAGVTFLDLINGTSTVNLGSGALTISGATTLTDNVNITATGGISFSSTINADNASSNDRTLTMTSGTGSTIAVAGNIGASQALAGLTITQSDGTTFSGTVDVSDSSFGHHYYY